MTIIIITAISLIIWGLWRGFNRWLIRWWGYRLWYRLVYLNLPSWKFSRRVKFFVSGRKCRVCGARHLLDVHHRSYHFLYWEWLFPWTLEVLCRKHHVEAHR